MGLACPSEALGRRRGAWDLGFIIKRAIPIIIATSAKLNVFPNLILTKSVTVPFVKRSKILEIAPPRIKLKP